MAAITPEQRKAASKAIMRLSIDLHAGHRSDILDALIAEGWGPVAAAEARGYRAGIEDAAAIVGQCNRTDREWGPGSLWDILTRESQARIRSLLSTDKLGEGL